jgi:spore photoproduct lyase
MHLEETERAETPKGKRKDAAYKAWRTIRKQKREAGARISKRLDDFITVEKITSIVHPETKQPPNTRYGIIVRQFDKTPPNIICGKFWELRWAFGCPFNCAYCYLRGTMRGNMKPRPVKLEYILEALNEVFTNNDFNGGKPALFNSGELCDSLMFPAIMSKIADRFEEQEKHKLGTLTKFGPENVRFLIEKERKNTICAWSINAPEVAKRWETLAPNPDLRIQAASMVSEAGYEVRIRIDPIFPIEDWRKHYDDLVYKLLSKLQPKRIILGTPRGLWKTIQYARKAGVDPSWTEYFDNIETGWGKKLPFQLRKDIYEFIYDRLDTLGYDRGRISICKETNDLLEALAIEFEPLTCQCYSH